MEFMINKSLMEDIEDYLWKVESEREARNGRLRNASENIEEKDGRCKR